MPPQAGSNAVVVHDANIGTENGNRWIYLRRQATRLRRPNHGAIAGGKSKKKRKTKMRRELELYVTKLINVGGPDLEILGGFQFFSRLKITLRRGGLLWETRKHRQQQHVLSASPGGGGIELAALTRFSRRQRGHHHSSTGRSFHQDRRKRHYCGSKATIQTYYY